MKWALKFLLMGKEEEEDQSGIIYHPADDDAQIQNDHYPHGHTPVFEPRYLEIAITWKRIIPIPAFLLPVSFI